MNKFPGITLMVLALAIAVVPAFTDCQSQGSALTLASGKMVPMKCHWTGIAEIAVGIPLLAVGAMMIAARRKESLLFLGATGGILGIFAVLLPNTLIGVCQTPTMICHTTMLPALTVLGSMVIAGNIGTMALAFRMKRRLTHATDKISA